MSRRTSFILFKLINVVIWKQRNCKMYKSCVVCIRNFIIVFNVHSFQSIYPEFNPKWKISLLLQLFLPSPSSLQCLHHMEENLIDVLAWTKMGKIFRFPLSPILVSYTTTVKLRFYGKQYISAYGDGENGPHGKREAQNATSLDELLRKRLIFSER